MKREVRIEQCYKRTWVKCKLSGHSYPDDKLLNTWKVISHSGLIGRYRSYEKAQKVKAEWQEYYDNRDNYLNNLKP